MKLGRPFLLALLVTAPLQAQLVPLGPESRVDSGKGRKPAYLDVAMEPDGSYFVVWAYSQEYASFGCTSGAIQARRFDREGRPLSKPFAAVRLANSCVEGLRVGPLVDGQRLLVWQNASGKYGPKEWLVSTLGSDGRAKRRKAFGIYYTSVIPLRSGRFLFVDGTPQDTKTELRGRTFSASGRPLGSAFPVAGDIGMGSFYIVGAAETSGGDLVVSWLQAGPGSERPDTYAQILHADGSRVGDAFLVAPYGDGVDNMRLAADVSGGFAFAWSAKTIVNNEVVPLVRARTYDADGMPRSPVVELARSTWDHPRSVADIAMNADGMFVPVWDFLTDWRADDVGAALVDGDGHLLGEEEPLADAPAGLQGHAAVATDGKGLWVTAWTGEGPQGTGVYVRLFRE